MELVDWVDSLFVGMKGLCWGMMLVCVWVGGIILREGVVVEGSEF